MMLSSWIDHSDGLENSAFLHKNLAIWSWLLIQDPLNVGNRQGLGFEGLPIVGLFVALRIWRSWSWQRR
ncbi:hypothetical protein G9444_5762 [Rhodococcus erythropolis]|uniref:Uncharacterized protein n=1 Tax=Rhodococcus erythropolis TaxID=1833 RepID=A0A6G9D137_RHOER|nr:hypothetical protein G9444_5762 [Rhodococcus erythropolis]